MDEYFEYLLGIVWKEGYNELLAQLYQHPFTHFVPNDDNRAADGKHLREEFLIERSRMGSFSFPPTCTFLEMLIALSYRVEYQLFDMPYGLDARAAFWTLIENLELGWCTDAAFNSDDGVGIIAEKVRVVNTRDYEGDGYGGLFPLREPKKDQRKVEIWYQMMAYLMENWEF